jgi:hypothetical protein
VDTSKARVADGLSVEFRHLGSSIRGGVRRPSPRSYSCK